MTATAGFRIEAAVQVILSSLDLLGNRTAAAPALHAQKDAQIQSQRGGETAKLGGVEVVVGADQVSVFPRGFFIPHSRPHRQGYRGQHGDPQKDGHPLPYRQTLVFLAAAQQAEQDQSEADQPHDCGDEAEQCGQLLRFGGAVEHTVCVHTVEPIL